MEQKIDVYGLVRDAQERTSAAQQELELAQRLEATARAMMAAWYKAKAASTTPAPETTTIEIVMRQEAADGTEVSRLVKEIARATGPGFTRGQS